MTKDADHNPVENAWNPGISSSIPPHLKPRITLFDPENGAINYHDAREAARLSGLPETNLAILNVERLIIHELLLRVTSDLYVPDGPNYADLGISLRSMVDHIYQRHMIPKLDVFRMQFDQVKSQIRTELYNILDKTLMVEVTGNRQFFGLWKGKNTYTRRDDDSLLAIWKKEAKEAPKASLMSSCYAALVRLGSAMMGQQGRLISDLDMMVDLASRLVFHDYGSQQVRAMITNDFDQAARAEGYRFLPPQAKPVVMNTKGASAAGKSTLRPKQRQLAVKLGTKWEDYAVISPDYWRKYLIDYDSLGEDYKYAAMLTGHELTMIDRKLDQYMAEKAAAATMPHLLIDRFRFDSFDTNAEGSYQSNLLTRFGDVVYLFFVITAPSQTVERAWNRGLSTQRYKAVDDLLYHNIEAFTGIPGLFYSWSQVQNKTIHFEFLDNDQPLGEPPRTIAFGKNKSMVILDPDALSNIDRYRHINVDARQPEDVLTQITELPYQFIRSCMDRLDQITFADFHTAHVYGQINHGRWSYFNARLCPDKNQLVDMLLSLGWNENMDLYRDKSMAADPVLDVETEHNHTVGLWANDT